MTDAHSLLEIEAPNGEDTFTLKVNGSITTEVEKDVTTDTLSANASEIIGTNINLNSITHTLECTIANMDEEDYPNRVYDSYENHNHGYATEIEHAGNNWGTVIVSGDLDNATLRWNRGGHTQEWNGSLTNVTTELIPSDASSNADHYQLTIEFSELEAVYE